MTIEEIRQRIADIDDSSDDGEYAHRQEDRLYRDVLQAIAGGVQNPSELAKAALESEDLTFDRFYSFAHA